MTRPFRLKAPQPLEFDEQKALFQWAEVASRQAPELALLYAIPNGMRASSPAEAARHKATGLKAGVPDCCLPVPRRCFHGLYIEMKRRGSTACDVSENQSWWLSALNEQGYLARVAVGWEEARSILLEYLELV